jgi:hypothetical protein
MDRRTWIFVANRLLTMQEVHFITDEMHAFLSQWKAHGKPLDAEGFCFCQAAVVLVANETEVQATGCSIDKINHWVREMGESISVDFFDRFNVLTQNKDGQWVINRFSAERVHESIAAHITRHSELQRMLTEHETL